MPVTFVSVDIKEMRKESAGGARTGIMHGNGLSYDAPRGSEVKP